MWFKLPDKLINQDNVSKVFTKPVIKGIGLFLDLADGDRILLGIFSTSLAANACIEAIQDHIQRKTEIIDLIPLVNLSNLSYGS
jgi:hypothetical protein